MKELSRSEKNLQDFLNCADWYGRLPSTKAVTDYEKRLAYWLIHMKQSKKGKSTCRWNEKLQLMANRNGFPTLFDVDTRRVHPYHLIGKSICGLEVIDKTEKLSEFGQTMFVCKDHGNGGAIVEETSYRLRRKKHDVSYDQKVEKAKDLCGKNFGCWKLMGIYDIEEGENSVWFCTRNDGKIDILKKLVLPSIEKMTKYFLAVDGKIDVDQPTDTGFLDLSSKRFGRWTVIGASHKASNSEYVWDCLCDCGEMGKVAGGKLRAGCSLSCGCLRKDTMTRLANEKIEAQKSARI